MEKPLLFYCFEKKKIQFNKKKSLFLIRLICIVTLVFLYECTRALFWSSCDFFASSKKKKYKMTADANRIMRPGKRTYRTAFFEIAPDVRRHLATAAVEVTRVTPNNNDIDQTTHSLHADVSYAASKHAFYNYTTRFQMTDIRGKRIQQLLRGARVSIPLTNTQLTPHEVADLEFELQTIPYNVHMMVHGKQIVLDSRSMIHNHN